LEYTIILLPPKCGLYTVQDLAVYRMYYKWQFKSRIWEEIKDLKNYANLKILNLKKPEETITFFARIISSTHIIFTDDETALLKELNYNLNNKTKIGSKLNIRSCNCYKSSSQ